MQNKLKSIGWVFLIGIQILSVSFFAVLVVGGMLTADQTPEPPKPEPISNGKMWEGAKGGPWKKDTRGRWYSVSERQDWKRARDAYFDCKKEFGNYGLCDSEEAEYRKYYG